MVRKGGIGILGGSFNPVHTGHVRMAVEVMERLGLFRVDLVPAAVPPHKSSQGLLPFDLRLELCELAVEGVPGLYANPIEGERPGPSYTCDTLTCYAAPPAELFFLLGAGTFLELPQWQRGLELPDLANLVCINRGFSAAQEQGVPPFAAVAAFVSGHWPEARPMSQGPEPSWQFPSGAQLICLEIPRLDIKAEDIRERWRSERNFSLLVPPGVEQWLKRNGSVLKTVWGSRSGTQ
ncbi:MAG: nicotinate (nicotinamide) nucleotide adenylyltransferase [Desulfovibrionaceae bacterium]